VIFVFHEEAGSARLQVSGELFRYLIKVRRHSQGDTIAMRNNATPTMLYRYTIEHIENRAAVLSLLQSAEVVVSAVRRLHIIWCVIDTKSIEKVLPTLTELGVAKISFVACARSQRNFKLDFQRFQRMVSAAMQQCGRSEFMEFEQLAGLEEALQRYEKLVYLDFCDTLFKASHAIDTVLVGCEGGFSDDERKLLASQQGFCLNTPMVLRSESAVCAVASQILLRPFKS